MNAESVSRNDWIRRTRQQLGWSTYELARRAGVSQPTVMNWESRERSGGLTLATLRRAATALDAELSYQLVPRENLPLAHAEPARPRAATPRTPRPRKSVLRQHQRPRQQDPNEIWGG